MAQTEAPGIEAIQEELSRHHELPRWILSSAALLALARGEKPVFGKRGRYFQMLFRLLGNSPIAIFVVRLVMIVSAVKNWLACLLISPAWVRPETVFIGFGAGPEQNMVAQLRSESLGQVVHVNQTRPASLALVSRPSLGRMLAYALEVPKYIYMALAKCECRLVRNHPDHWLPTAAIRMKEYILFKAWFDALPSAVSRLVFIAADVPAFAVLGARKTSVSPRVDYQQHGMLRKSIIFPGFDHIEALTVPEARYLEARLPGTVSMKRLATEIPVHYQPVIVFTSIYNTAEFDKRNYLQILKELLEWSAGLSLSVVLRLHPCESDEFWVTHFPDLFIDRTSMSFDDCLNQHSPLFVFSWFSTALIDALKHGYLPCMVTSGISNTLEDLIFPLADISINWPRDIELIKTLSINPELYRKELSDRQVIAFGTAA